MVGALFPSYTLHMVRNAAMRVILTCFGLEGFSQELRQINAKKLPSSGRERFSSNVFVHCVKANVVKSVLLLR